jgi:diketogulonate reductase-like aldo/keto reductase
VNGVEKVKTIDFLAREMTLGQAALKWLLAEPLVVTTLPNIYDDEQLAEFAATSELPEIGEEVMRRIDELDRTNFGVNEDAMKYKGAMTRTDGANLDLQDARNPAQRPAQGAHSNA